MDKVLHTCSRTFKGGALFRASDLYFPALFILPRKGYSQGFSCIIGQERPAKASQGCRIPRKRKDGGGRQEES